MFWLDEVKDIKMKYIPPPGQPLQSVDIFDPRRARIGENF